MDEMNEHDILSIFLSVITVIIFSCMIIFMILFMFFWDTPISEEEILCIINKSVLYIGRGHDSDKQILEISDYYQNFTVIECDDCEVIPSWVIENVTYEGFMNLKRLKLLTDC